MKGYAHGRAASLMVRLRALVIVLLVANLAACGFYLAGRSPLPPQLVSMQLQADNLDGRQKAALRQQLIRAGAMLKENLGDGVVRLQVTIRDLPERKLVDTAGSGKTITRLFRQLGYSLKTATDEPLVAQSTIQRQLDIELDSNDLAGIEYEKERAGVLLDQALFGQLIFRLKHYRGEAGD